MRYVGRPGDAFWQRYMWPGVDMPSLTAVKAWFIWWITPRGIGDDVAVFAQQGLYHVKNSPVGQCVLACGAAIQHFIAKHFFATLVSRHADVCGDFVENLSYFRGQFGYFILGEYGWEENVAFALKVL